jgi:hypothetical protein
MKTLHANVTNAQAARDAGEHRRVTQEQNIENGANNYNGRRRQPRGSQTQGGKG